MSPLPVRETNTQADCNFPGAVTHDTLASTTWIDIVLAEEDWVRREFDELIAHGWGGSGPPGPAYQPGNARTAEVKAATPPHPGSTRSIRCRAGSEQMAATPGPARGEQPG
jgi:hypothetical protein